MISPLATGARGWRNLTPFRARGRGLSGQFVPQQLGLTALYDADNGGSSSQITDSGGAALAALAFAASTAAPTFLPAPGSTPYVYLPGVAGNYVSTPDAAALELAGDLEVVLRAAAADWTPSAAQTLLARWITSSAWRAWRLDNGTTNFLSGFWSPDGSSGATLNKLSSVAAGLTDGAFHWLKWTLDVDNGAAGNANEWYTAADAPAEPSMTKLGATVTTAVATSLYAAGQAPLEIGSMQGGTAGLFIGRVARAILRNGIAGGAVADFDAANCAQTGFTDALGRVWAVNYGTSGLFAVVKSPAAGDVAAGILGDGSNDYATGPTAAIPALAAGDACTLFCVVRPRATMTANMTFFSTRNGTGPGVTLRMASATTVVADISDGTTTVTTPAVTIVPGTRYVLGVVIPPSGGAYCFANNALGSTQARTGNTETGGALTVLANSTPANFCRTHARVPYASVPRAISAGDLAQLVTHYGGGV